MLHAFVKTAVRGAEIVLVVDERASYNSEMSAGLLSGAYELADLHIDLTRLAERAGARVVTEPVSRIELAQRVVVAGTERIPFDLCSLDVPGWPEGADLPGVVEHALPLRPASALPGVRTAIEARLAVRHRRIDCVVVGGGRTGVEAAFVMMRLLRSSSAGGVVTIVDGAATILAHDPSCRDTAYRELTHAGACFALGARVVAVESNDVLLASGARLPADIVLWATSAAASSVIARSGLPHDARGRLLVDESQRSRDGAPLWAAGDCAATDTPAVERGARDGVQLERSLRAALSGSDARVVQPPRREPCWLDTGDGRALVEWGMLRARSRWAWWFKQRRDRRFVTELARP